MKTKVYIVLAILSVIGLNGIAQGLENKFGLGINGPTSFTNRIQCEASRNLNYRGEEIFHSTYYPSTSINSYEMLPQPVINNLTHNDDITEEQVGLIFNRTKEFPENTQLSFAFISNGRVNFYGIKRQNNALINIENHSSVFEIGSITKIFTATLLANYVNDGILDPEDHINNYLPFKLHDDIQISFKELANHTSGLPGIPSNMFLSAIFKSGNPYKACSEDKLVQYMSEKVKLNRRTGKNFIYSNLGAGLLGYTLSNIENKSYQDLLIEKIFSKYGMTNSSTIRMELESKLIGGLNKKGSKASNWDFASLESAGAILSTTEDLSKFAVAQFDELNRELALTRDKTFTIDSNRAIGLGWFISKTESGINLLRHEGATGGYTSSIITDTKNKRGIVILSNVSGFNKKMGNIETLCFELMITLGKE
ncbi:MAG: class A beta-lactamase-related serine hydrolase [Bacteroidetes bacterium]|nr:MAG: class A beta-lactamase-related serine hydrolase [Bacteroidota bacterium]